MWSHPFASEKQTEVSGQHLYKSFLKYDDQQEYVAVICNSISVKIVLIWN